MRRSNQTVFNEFLPQGTTSTSPAYTSAELNAKLGHFDQMGIQAVIDNVGGGTIGALTVTLQHSADGRNWSDTGTTVTTATLSTTAVNLAYANWLGSSTVLLGYARFQVYFSNSTTAAHVHLLVTQRDQS